jgi:Putative  PD-(D/E)XK family member, (DUF4420)
VYWKGTQKAHQDFQLPAGAVEIKTTLAKQPQVVRITSERQLDDSMVPLLFLEILALDARENSGETLPQMVASLRVKLATHALAQQQFDDALLAGNYLDAHSERYSVIGYTVRAEKLFRVWSEFPRLVENKLPAGIGDINYGLSVAACENFLVSHEKMITQLTKL